MAKHTAAKNIKESAEEKKEKASLYLLPSVQQKVKYICLKEKLFQNDVYTDAIIKYIKEWEKKNGEIKL